MESLNIKGTYDTPTVIFNPDIETFEISGRSYPEDTAEFYIPVLEWVETYVSNPNNRTQFIFRLDYFNSSSYKPFLDILLKPSDICIYMSFSFKEKVLIIIFLDIQFYQMDLQY